MSPWQVEQRERKERAKQFAIFMRLALATTALMAEALHVRKLRGEEPAAITAVMHVQRVMRGHMARDRVRNLFRLKRAAGGMLFKFRENVSVLSLDCMTQRVLVLYSPAALPRAVRSCLPQHREKQRMKAASQIMSFIIDFGVVLSGTLNSSWPRQARWYRQQILKCQRCVRAYLACTRAREIALSLLWEREAAVIETAKCNREVHEWMMARARANTNNDAGLGNPVPIAVAHLFGQTSGGATRRSIPSLLPPRHSPPMPVTAAMLGTSQDSNSTLGCSLPAAKRRSSEDTCVLRQLPPHTACSFVLVP